MTTAEKIALLKAEQAADSLTESEAAVCAQTGVTHAQFRAARAERRQVALNDANATALTIQPFVIAKVPDVRFEGMR